MKDTTIGWRRKGRVPSAHETFRFPPEAVALEGLRIGKGGHRPDLPCFLTYSDRDERIHEIAIGFAEMIAILNYLNETRQCLPLRIRLDS